MFEANIARGAALLDEIMPGWVDKINLDSLMMYNAWQCILGQLWSKYPGHGSPYWKALNVIWPDDDWNERSALSFAHGYNSSSYSNIGTLSYSDTDTLQDEWKIFITNRREAIEQPTIKPVDKSTQGVQAATTGEIFRVTFSRYGVEATAAVSQDTKARFLSTLIADNFDIREVTAL